MTESKNTQTAQVTSSSPARFEVYDVSIELVVTAASVGTQLRRRSRSLAQQFERAVHSVPLNIAEGAQRRGADRLQHYRVAAGSVAECRAVLDVAVASGWITPERLEAVRELLDREAGMLYRLTHPRRLSVPVPCPSPSIAGRPSSVGRNGRRERSRPHRDATAWRSYRGPGACQCPHAASP